jgi:hypothetical protein
MPVRADRIGRQPLAGLAEQRVLLQAAAGAGDARLRVDDDVVDVDQLAFASGTSASSTAVG